MKPKAAKWRVPVRVDEIPDAGRRFDLHADAATREALARTAGLQALPRLDASFEITRHGRDGVRVRGTVSGTVGQTCVVSLEPVENEIAEQVDLVFMPASQ